MTIIGSAHAVKVALAILRMKVLAVLLGPSGVGLLGIYNNLQATVGGVAGLGMGSSGVRQIAAARSQETRLGRVRRVLFWAHLVQGVAAMIAIWLLRKPISVWLLGDAARATEVGLIGVAVLFMLMGSAQKALLQGMRRVGELGRVTVLGALAGTAVGLLAVWLWGERGLIWFLLVQPLTAFLVAWIYTSRLPPPGGKRLTLVGTWHEWRPMAQIGAVFMLGALTTTVTTLLMRSRLAHDLGIDAAGQFAAALGITITYVGFLLGAMAADYYPRLTEVIRDRVAANRLMNDQTQLGLAIGGPVLLLLIGLAPWVITLVYSPEFGPAATLLQWQTAGNMFKLASWPLGFALVAAARSGLFLSTQLSLNVIFLGIFWIWLPSVGLPIAGVGFLIAYIVHLGISYLVVRRLQGFRFEVLTLRLIAVNATLALGLLMLAQAEPLVGAGAALMLAAAAGFVGGHIVLTKIGRHGRAAPLARIYAAIGWPIQDPV